MAIGHKQAHMDIYDNRGQGDSEQTHSSLLSMFERNVVIKYVITVIS